MEGRALRWSGVYGYHIFHAHQRASKDLTFMTPELKEWISSNTLLILGSSLAGFTLTCSCSIIFKVNVLKVVVLLGTFSHAMALPG